MSAFKLRSQSPAQAGFSLVELLVALLFTAILTSGMLRIFASSVSGFYTQQESMGLQRSSRFALNMVEDEIMQAGYLFPPRNLSGNLSEGSASVQPPVLVQQTSYQPVWSDPNGTSVNLPKVDELQFVQDLNLEVEGTLTAAVAATATSATVAIPSGTSTLSNYITGSTNNPLVMVMLDSQFNQVDMLQISSITASGSNWTVNVDATSSGQDQYGNMIGGGFFSGAFNNAHTANAPCTFIAPLQVIRYTVVPRALDPSNPTNMVPCLVRQTAPLVKTAFFAPTYSTSAHAQQSAWTEQILVEGVSGFKVDISLDGGQTFLRYNADGTLKANMDTWANVYTALDTAIKALRTTSILAIHTGKGLSDPLDPLWFNYAPVTFRLDVSTRSRLARGEYNTTAPATPAFRTRTVTMMISPKNFALGSSL